MVDQLREKYGAKIKNISIPHVGTIGHAHGITILSEFLTADWRIVNYQSENPNDRYSPASQAMLEFAKQFTATDFIAAQQVRTMTLDYFEDYILLEIVRSNLGNYASRMKIENFFKKYSFLKKINNFRNKHWKINQLKMK